MEIYNFHMDRKHKLSSLLNTCFLSLLFCTANAAPSAPYVPVGVQLDVPVSTVINDWGWSVVYQGLYKEEAVPISTLFAGVNSTDYVMYAARETGAENFALLAATLASDAWTITVDNGTTTSNGAEWYYNSQSLGFAGLGDLIQQSSADVSSVWNDYPNGELRLSWHTTGNDDSGVPLVMNGGWRAGMAESLNESEDWERFVLVIHMGPAPAELAAEMSGLPMANVVGQTVISANQTVTGDVNNHLFNLIAGDGEEEASSDLAANLDEGVTLGQGDGPEDAIARKIKRSRQWEVFTTVNYGTAKLRSIGNQSGVTVDAWAPSVGVERHLSRGLALGFAVSFLTSEQHYKGGLGSVDLEGPGLSTYLTFVRKNFWSSLLYSFGSYELNSQRNPGFGFPAAFGNTRTYTNAVQYNTGWNFRFQNNTLVTGPFAGIDYLHGSVDEYSETSGGLAALTYAKQSYESLVTRVGWAASKKIHRNFATVTPQVRLSYERQNLKNNGTSVSLINAPFTAAGGNQSPGQDYVVASAGINFAFNDAFNLLLTYQGQFFREDMQSHFGGVRLSYKF